MKIALHQKEKRLVVLGQSALRLFDVRTGAPVLVAERALADGYCVAACDAYLAVIVGNESPSGKAVKNATLRKFSWILEPLGEVSLGTVEKNGVVLDASGGRVAFADWASFEIAVADAQTGQRLASGAASFPTGLSWSPEGARLFVGVTGQGGGAGLVVDVEKSAPGNLQVTELPEGKPSPGLADASYFTVFGAAGQLAAVSNERWGGRGVFVYDVEAGVPLWSRVLESEAQETDEWYAFAASFASRDALLLVAGPGELRAYGARDGRELGAMAVPGDGRDGFIVEQDVPRVWVAGETPTVHPFPRAWVLGPLASWPSDVVASSAPCVRDANAGRRARSGEGVGQPLTSLCVAALLSRPKALR
jgi:hypothetical protein